MICSEMTAQIIDKDQMKAKAAPARPMTIFSSTLSLRACLLAPLRTKTGLVDVARPELVNTSVNV
jgi:hypothetical protein